MCQTSGKKRQCSKDPGKLGTEVGMQMIADQFGDGWYKSITRLVVVAFPEVSVLVAGVASVSRLPVAVSGEVFMLGLLKPFHIDAVLSLSPFLSQSPACLLRRSFFYCCSGAMLALSLLPACVVSLFPELVPRFLLPLHDYHWFCCCCCCSIRLYLWCLCLCNVWVAVNLL